MTARIVQYRLACLSICVVIACAMFLTGGCATQPPLKLYDGAERLPSELAIVQIGKTTSYGIRINGVDGTKVSQSSSQIILTPGTHNIRCGLYGGTSLLMFVFPTTSYNVEWYMQAGHTYAINSDWQKIGFSYRRPVVWVQDIASSNVVASTHPDFIPLSVIATDEHPIADQRTTSKSKLSSVEQSEKQNDDAPQTRQATDSPLIEQSNVTQAMGTTTRSPDDTTNDYSTTVDKLKHLKMLKEEGILTDDEYEVRRRSLVDKL